MELQLRWNAGRPCRPAPPPAALLRNAGMSSFIHCTWVQVGRARPWLARWLGGSL